MEPAGGRINNQAKPCPLQSVLALSQTSAARNSARCNLSRGRWACPCCELCRHDAGRFAGGKSGGRQWRLDPARGGLAISDPSLGGPADREPCGRGWPDGVLRRCGSPYLSLDAKQERLLPIRSASSRSLPGLARPAVTLLAGVW